MLRWRVGILFLALLVCLGGAAMALAEPRAPSMAIEAFQQPLPPSGARIRDLVGGEGAATQDAPPAYSDLQAPLAGQARPPRGGGESLDSQLTLTSVADATILQNLGDRNLSDTYDMWVGFDRSTDPAVGTARSLVRFDLSPLPAGSNISSATLKLFLVNSWDLEGASKTVTAYRIDGSWTESGVTWNNAPAYAEAYGSASVTHGDWKYYDLDVTELVRAWSSGADANDGIMVRGQESGLGRRGFGTREAASEGDYVPKLVIEYTAAEPTATPTRRNTPSSFVKLPMIRRAPMPTATPTPTAVPAPTSTQTPTTGQELRYSGTTSQGKAIDIYIKADRSAVTRLGLRGSVTCPGASQTFDKMVTFTNGLPITNRRFEANLSNGSSKMDRISGEFNSAFTEASGDMEFWLVLNGSAICSATATWSATRQ